MRSESTSAFGQPSDTKETRGGRFMSIGSWLALPPNSRRLRTVAGAIRRREHATAEEKMKCAGA
jgi:hypothetical protein